MNVLAIGLSELAEQVRDLVGRPERIGRWPIGPKTASPLATPHDYTPSSTTGALTSPAPAPNFSGGAPQVKIVSSMSSSATPPTLRPPAPAGLLGAANLPRGWTGPRPCGSAAPDTPKASSSHASAGGAGRCPAAVTASPPNATPSMRSRCWADAKLARVQTITKPITSTMSTSERRTPARLGAFQQRTARPVEDLGARPVHLGVPIDADDDRALGRHLLHETAQPARDPFPRVEPPRVLGEQTPPVSTRSGLTAPSPR